MIGQIHAAFIVQCTNCPSSYVGGADTKEDFEIIIQQRGWLQSNGRWYCPGCLSPHILNKPVK